MAHAPPTILCVASFVLDPIPRGVCEHHRHIIYQVFYQFTKYSEEKGVAGVAVKIASNVYGGVGGGGVQNGWMSLTSDPSFED